MSEPEAEGRIRVPFELEGGTYANFLSAFPVTVIFEFLRILNERMTYYERRYGEIRRPEEQ